MQPGTDLTRLKASSQVPGGGPGVARLAPAMGALLALGLVAGAASGAAGAAGLGGGDGADSAGPTPATKVIHLGESFGDELEDSKSKPKEILPLLTPKARLAGSGAAGVRSAAFGVCLEIRPASATRAVVTSLSSRGVPAGAGFYFEARVGAGDAVTDPCYGAFARPVDAWKTAIGLRADAELERAGVRVVGHRVVSLSALGGPAATGAAAAGAMKPDALSLPGSAFKPGEGTGVVPDLGRLSDLAVPLSDEMISALPRPTGAADATEPPTIGVVATGRADVFAAPDAWLPPTSLAMGTLRRFEEVVVLGAEFRCDSSAACLYWHHVLFGKGSREGWVPAGHLVPVGFGAPSKDGDHVAYLTPRARLPYTPAPFFSTAKLPSTTVSDVYDLWMYDADAGALGRVETFSLKAGTTVADLAWDHESALRVLDGGGATIFRASAHIGAKKKYTKKKRKKAKPAAPPPKVPTPRV